MSSPETIPAARPWPLSLHARGTASPWSPRTSWAARVRWRPAMGLETMALLISVFFALCCNLPFWRLAIPHGASQWKLAVSLFLLLTGLHGFLLGLLLGRRWARPLLALLFVATACAMYYMNAYGVYLDADMLRNVLHTDWQESRELLTTGLFFTLLLYAVLPIVLVWRTRIVRRSMPRTMLVRGGFLLAMWVAMAAGAALSFKDLSALVRNRHEARYLVTPGNYLYSLGKVLLAQPPGAKAPLLPIGEDAVQAPRSSGTKPRLLVLVVGETARAQDWGLNGYARQTTPELSQLDDLVNFPDVHSCGSSTEVSLPCMFSLWGRHDYDEKAIRSHQSLLHVLQRAGIRVLWRDNQSGCKRVCDGLPAESLSAAENPEFCGGRCFDGILLEGLTESLPDDGKDHVIVLHMLGNHGPSYFDRYPPQFNRFVPVCESPELGQCSREQIVNAYDNALLYTDHVLASAIAGLREVGTHDTALIYVSDHGESLGENDIYLHGMPYAIAPQQQLRVPMVMWFSPRFAADEKLDLTCLRNESAKPASHDNLFPSVLGLFDVKTAIYDRSRDLFAGCRRG